jgi:iron(III) transport system ATP-binding protein
VTGRHGAALPTPPAEPAVPGGGTGSVSLHGVRKSFGTHPVLAGVDLDVADGAVAAVLGPSGSGKTTMLRILAGFERPDGGSVVIGGTVVDDGRRHVPIERRRIGYVPQEGSLFPHLDVSGNVGFGLPRRARGARVAELLAMVGLEELGGRYPHQLSGGQQQRVALARALAPRPRLVLLDEPFASLDANLRAQVRSDVLAILRRAGTTAILVTHDQDEALSSADVVAVLRQGAIVQVDTPFELYNHPVDAEVASFVGEANLMPGVARGATVETALGRLALVHPAPDGRALTVLVRPEQVVVEPEDGVPAGARATVAAFEYHGHDTTIRLVPRLRPSGFPEVVLARLAGRHAVRESAGVRLEIAGAVEAWPAAADPLPGSDAT